MIGYKVVIQDHEHVMAEEYKSAITYESAYKLIYRVGEITTATPNTMGVFFFPNLRDAIDFTGCSSIILQINASPDAHPVEYMHDYRRLHICYSNNYAPTRPALYGSWVANYVEVIDIINWNGDCP